MLITLAKFNNDIQVTSSKQTLSVFRYLSVVFCAVLFSILLEIVPSCSFYDLNTFIFRISLPSLLSFLQQLLFLLCTSFKCWTSARVISLSSSQLTFSPFSGFLAPCMFIILKVVSLGQSTPLISRHESTQPT